MIAIPNMEMPRTCYECDSDFASSIGCEEWWVFEEGKEKRSPDCPLIEIDLEKDIPTIWYNRQTRRYEPKGTKQEVYERLYKLKNGERRSDESNRKTLL